MSLVFCPTMPQSGTWFVLRLFERLGYKIEHTGEIMSRIVNMTVDISIPTILHTHVFAFYYNPAPYKESWPSYGGDAIQEYIVRKNKMSIGGIKLLASMFKTVIPIRDPLASLLTRERRAPNLRHFYIVDGYVEVVRELSNHPNVKFFPLDLNLTEEERYELLVDVLTHCGVDVSKHSEEINDTAIHWRKENVTPNNSFREHYDAGDIDKLKELLGHKWAEVAHLKNMGGILVPFLSKLGYNEKRTLIW